MCSSRCCLAALALVAVADYDGCAAAAAAAAAEAASSSSVVPPTNTRTEHEEEERMRHAEAMDGRPSMPADDGTCAPLW